VCVWYLLLFRESWVVLGRSLGMRLQNHVARSLVPREGVWNWDYVVVNHFFIKFWGMGSPSSCITNYFSVVLLTLFLPLQIQCLPLSTETTSSCNCFDKVLAKENLHSNVCTSSWSHLHTWSGMVLCSTNRHIIVCGLIWNGMSEILLTVVYCMQPKPHSASM